MQPKSLFVDARLWNASGIGTFLRNLLPFFLEDRGLALTLLCHSSDSRELTQKGFSTIPVQCKLFSLKEQFEMPAKIAACDLFWSPNFNIPIFPLRAKKILVTIHDTFHLTFASEFSFPARMYARFMYHYALRKAAAITTDSHFSASEIQKHYPKFSSELNVITLGVPSNFQPCNDEKQKEEIRDKYQLPVPFFLMIGNFKPHKNFSRLSRSFRKLSSSHHLVLIGKKQELKEEKYHSIPHVLTEELPIIYSLATALIFPSLYEGFGFPPIEAMACGCPALVSNVASIPEVCGDAAEYVDPYFEDSIKRGLQSILSPERRAELTAKGFSQAKKYSWKTCSERYLELIHRLCAQ